MTSGETWRASNGSPSAPADKTPQPNGGWYPAGRGTCKEADHSLPREARVTHRLVTTKPASRSPCVQSAPKFKPCVAPCPPPPGCERVINNHCRRHLPNAWCLAGGHPQDSRRGSPLTTGGGQVMGAGLSQSFL